MKLRPRLVLSSLAMLLAVVIPRVAPCAPTDAGMSETAKVQQDAGQKDAGAKDESGAADAGCSETSADTARSLNAGGCVGPVMLVSFGVLVFALLVRDFWSEKKGLLSRQSRLEELFEKRGEEVLEKLANLERELRARDESVLEEVLTRLKGLEARALPAIEIVDLEPKEVSDRGGKLVLTCRHDIRHPSIAVGQRVIEEVEVKSDSPRQVEVVIPPGLAIGHHACVLKVPERAPSSFSLWVVEALGIVRCIPEQLTKRSEQLVLVVRPRVEVEKVTLKTETCQIEPEFQPLDDGSLVVRLPQDVLDGEVEVTVAARDGRSTSTRVSTAPDDQGA